MKASSCFLRRFSDVLFRARSHSSHLTSSLTLLFVFGRDRKRITNWFYGFWARGGRRRKKSEEKIAELSENSPSRFRWILFLCRWASYPPHFCVNPPLDYIHHQRRERERKRVQFLGWAWCVGCLFLDIQFWRCLGRAYSERRLLRREWNRKENIHKIIKPKRKDSS